MNGVVVQKSTTQLNKKQIELCGLNIENVYEIYKYMKYTKYTKYNIKMY